MQRENSFDKQFHDHMDFECEEKNRELCDSRNCVCACKQIAEIMRRCRENYLDGRKYYLLTIFDDREFIELGSLSSFNIKKSKKSFTKAKQNKDTRSDRHRWI